MWHSAARQCGPMGRALVEEWPWISPQDSVSPPILGCLNWEVFGHKGLVCAARGAGIGQGFWGPVL